jgi:hypothetical protein
MNLRHASLVVALMLGACASPPSPPPAPPPPEPAPVIAPAPPPREERICPSCDEQNREVARLRQELAQREAELKELRSSQRDQVKVIQESTREVARAKVKLRRLATQADAASYLSEVEVALQSVRGEAGAEARLPLLDLAQGIIESSAAPFAAGDFGMAMDRAAQAEQLVSVVADERTRRATPMRGVGEVPFQVGIALRVTAESSLRRQPAPKAPVLGVLAKDTQLVAHATKGTWVRVETLDGKSGWVDQTSLGLR